MKLEITCSLKGKCVEPVVSPTIGKFPYLQGAKNLKQIRHAIIDCCFCKYFKVKKI